MLTQVSVNYTLKHEQTTSLTTGHRKIAIVNVSPKRAEI